MFSPFFLEVVQTSPEGGHPSFNLRRVSICDTLSIIPTYHQLSHNRLIEVLRASVHPHSNQISTVNMFLLQAPLPFLDSGDSLLFQLTGFSFLLCLPPFRHIILRAGPNPKKRKIRSASSSGARRIHWRRPVRRRYWPTCSGRVSLSSVGRRGLRTPRLSGVVISHGASSRSARPGSTEH